jgi:broad specificity phosphatase PhoE
MHIVVHLSANGKSQARKCGAWLQNEGLVDFDLNVTSNMFRAQDTAAFIDPEIIWHESHLLQERSWGLLISLPHNERSAMYGGNFLGKGFNPFNWLPPGGESMNHVIERLRLFFNNLAVFSDKYDSVRIVCHGEVMWALRFVFENMSVEQYNYMHEHRVPKNIMYNCHVLHYLREDTEDHYSRMRSVCTYDPARYDSGYIPINQ